MRPLALALTAALAAATPPGFAASTNAAFGGDRFVSASEGAMPSDDRSLNLREDAAASGEPSAKATPLTTTGPAPQNLALMLAGLGGLSLVARRRRG